MPGNLGSSAATAAATIIRRFQALPNGDLLAAYYNTMLGGERGVCVSIMTTRLRHGATEWDMPASWPDMVDADDEGPVIWNDRGNIWLFWGSPRMEAGYPFQYTTSVDNGATWSPVHFPLFRSKSDLSPLNRSTAPFVIPRELSISPWTDRSPPQVVNYSPATMKARRGTIRGDARWGAIFVHYSG